MTVQTVQTADWMKTSKPVGAFAALDPTESLGEGIGSSYPVIGYKGKIWSIRRQGENHLLLRPDDGTPIGYIDVIILRQAKTKAKSFYPDGFDEQGSMGKRPTCASIDGLKPDPDVVTAQSALCATCPRNEWHTDAKGHKTRDCTDYKRLSVLLLPNQTKALFGTPLMEPAFLRIPPDSLNDLAVFGDNMANQGWHYSSFVTRISFDSTKAHPKFQFKALQALEAKDANLIIAMREEPMAQRITGEDEIARRAVGAITHQSNTQTNGTAPSPAVPAAAALQAGSLTPAAAPASQPVQAQQTQTVQVEAEALANPGLGFADPTTTKAPAQPETIDLPSQGGGAFGLNIEVAAEPALNIQPGAMVGQSSDDVGAAVDNPDLDAMIAGMLATK